MSFTIEGTPQFVAATETALQRLQSVGWQPRGLTNFTETAQEEGVAGYVMGTTYAVMPRAWQAPVEYYAQTIVHEDTHVINPSDDLTEQERIAMRAERDVASSVGWQPRHSAQEAENPTHHYDWFARQGVDARATERTYAQSAPSEPSSTRRRATDPWHDYDPGAAQAAAVTVQAAPTRRRRATDPWHDYEVA